jgi:uncharacterized protein
MKISILEFSVENFRIFKEKATFSMFARKSEHTFVESGQNLLKTSLIYGPNASGKTSLFNAFHVLRNGVVNSANNPENSILPYQPFMLSDQENAPIFFEIIFSLNKKIFRYNFSFLKNNIVAESLFEVSSTGNEREHFKRKGQDIKVSLDFKESKDVADKKTRKEVLFISAASQWNNELAMQIVKGFKSINVISCPNSDSYRGYTMKLFKEDGDKKNRILDFLKKADFCIEDGVVRKMEVKIPEFIKEQMGATFKEATSNVDTVFFSHSKFNSKGNRVGVAEFNLGDESAGTQKFFDVLGPIVDTLENGKVLFIDEFDNSLHPFLTKLIIDLFEKSNSQNAQLIVTTHDTSLLSYKELNKEQFWFTEKDKLGTAKIFSLAEFDVRNDIEFSKKYLEGRFGALPFIDFKN